MARRFGSARMANADSTPRIYVSEYMPVKEDSTCRRAVRCSTPMQLVWAENVARKTGGRVLIATPIAVGHQTVAEGAKFGVECTRESGRITVTNYERLHHFDPSDFVGMGPQFPALRARLGNTARMSATERT